MFVVRIYLTPTRFAVRPIVDVANSLSHSTQVISSRNCFPSDSLSFKRTKVYCAVRRPANLSDNFYGWANDGMNSYRLYLTSIYIFPIFPFRFTSVGFSGNSENIFIYSNISRQVFDHSTRTSLIYIYILQKI